MKIILTIIGNNPAYLSSRYGYMYLTLCKQNQNKKVIRDIEDCRKMGQLIENRSIALRLLFSLHKNDSRLKQFRRHDCT